MEAQLESIHVACRVFARFALFCNAQSVLINKIVASDLSRKFFLLECAVGWVGRKRPEIFLINNHLVSLFFVVNDVA